MEITEKVKPISTPDTDRGAHLIDRIVTFLRFYYALPVKDQRNELLRCFQANSYRFELVTKFNASKKNFASFWLNLDVANKVQLLNYFQNEFTLGLGSKGGIKLSMPDIDNWHSLGKSMFGENADFTKEDVRIYADSFNVKSTWDVYPHDLVWIDRFMLYCFNNSIVDEYYNGEKFGTYQNWSDYFIYISQNHREAKIKAIVERLIDYV